MSSSLLFFGVMPDPGSGASTIVVTSWGVGPGVITQVDVTAGVLLPGITSEGTGITGFIGNPVDGESIVKVTSDGEGLWGDIGTLGDAPAIKITSIGVGLWGGIADGEGNINVTSDGVGAWGGLSEGTSVVVVTSSADATPGPSGSIGSGESIIVITSNGSGFNDGITGSGASVIVITSSSGPSSVTGEIAGDVTRVVFPVNVKGMAVATHSTPFTSMVVVGGNVYATSGSGIHLVGGNTDNGTEITAVVAKGPIDFGSGMVKVATDLFMRLMAESGFKIEMTSGHRSGSVTVADGVTHVHGCKIDLPRGVQGRELFFTLSNVDGGYFELSEMEFLILMSQVRRGRQTNG